MEGVDFTYQDGVPVLTTTGVAETALPVGYTGAPAYVNTLPGHQDYVKKYYEWQKRCSRVAMLMPTLGLYSPTDLSTGATLAKTLRSVIDDIVQGRKSTKDWSKAIKGWRSSGGDAIRREYESSHAATQ